MVCEQAIGAYDGVVKPVWEDSTTEPLKFTLLVQFASIGDYYLPYSELEPEYHAGDEIIPDFPLLSYYIDPISPLGGLCETLFPGVPRRSDVGQLWNEGPGLFGAISERFTHWSPMLATNVMTRSDCAKLLLSHCELFCLADKYAAFALKNLCLFKLFRTFFGLPPCRAAVEALIPSVRLAYSHLTHGTQARRNFNGVNPGVPDDRLKKLLFRYLATIPTNCQGSKDFQGLLADVPWFALDFLNDVAAKGAEVISDEDASVPDVPGT